MKKILFSIICLCSSFIILAQSPSFTFAKQFAGDFLNGSSAIKTDASGNIYTTGNFAGTVDFDPGAGVFNLTSLGSSGDMFISKLDAFGNFLWAKKFSGTTLTEGKSIAVDATGNVYTTGNFNNTADFDPGTGVYNLTATGSNDIFISKLDASGNFVWAKSFGWSLDDYGYGIAVDVSGDIYTTGVFTGTTDFDPGPGVFNMSNFGASNDAFILKLNNSGNFVWAKQLGGNSNDSGFAIDVDALGNVYTTGIFIGTADFDPGVGTYSLTNGGGNDDVFISKLDISGNFVWAKNLGGASNENAVSITVDPVGNVYTTGVFTNITDFDPGVGTFTMITIAGSNDVFISKLDNNGSFLWAKQIGGANSDVSRAVSSDLLGNVYITGGFFDTVDFDPGMGIFNLSSVGDVDIFVLKLDAAGNFVWATEMGGSSVDGSTGIFIDASGSVFITGGFIATVDFDPGNGIFNLTCNSYSDSFIHKMCQAPSAASAINGPATVCIGSSSIYSVTPNVFATSYSWLLPSGWVSSGSTNSILATTGSSGVFSVTVNNICGPSSIHTISVTVDPCSGINKNFNSELDIKIYPNPFNNKINIVSNLSQANRGKQIVEIFNAYGETIFIDKTEDKEIEINLSEQPNGIYFIRIGSVTKKIIKN